MGIASSKAGSSPRKTRSTAHVSQWLTSVCSQQFPDQEALGQYLAGDGKTNPDAEIVGVVAHVKHFGLDATSACSRNSICRSIKLLTTCFRSSLAHEPYHPHDGGPLKLDRCCASSGAGS